MNSRFKIGDPVFVVHTNFRQPMRRPTTISKIGRKYVYVANSKDPFDPRSGVVQDGHGHAQLMTQVELDLEAANERADKELRRYGIETWRMKPLRRIALHGSIAHLIAAWDAEAAKD